MFTLTSSSKKLAVLALSAVVSVASFQSVALAFAGPQSEATVVQLPTVVVVGYRASLGQDAAQAAIKLAGKAAG